MICKLNFMLQVVVMTAVLCGKGKYFVMYSFPLSQHDLNRQLVANLYIIIATL